MLTQFAIDRGLNISFIEEMPLGVIGDHDRAEAYYPSDQIRSDLEQRYTLVPTTETTGGPARYYRVAGTETRPLGGQRPKGAWGHQDTRG